MGMTEAAIQAPSLEDDATSFAAIGGPDRVREQIEAERVASEGGIVSAEITAFQPGGFTYASQLNMANGGSLLEQVLNNPEKLADIANDPEALEQLSKEAENVIEMQSTLQRVLAGELMLGDANRSELRNISNQMGNLPGAPRALLQSIRLWSMNEKNGDASMLTREDGVPETTEGLTGKLSQHDALRDIAGNTMDAVNFDAINKVLAEGPKAPEPPPLELETAGLGR